MCVLHLRNQLQTTPATTAHHNLNAIVMNNYYFINTIDHNKIEVKRRSYPDAKSRRAASRSNWNTNEFDLLGLDKYEVN